MSNEIEVRSREGFETIAKYLPADFEELARQHKVLETQYGEAKIKTADDLLRLILLHAGADLGLRQTVTLMAEAKGPAVSHVTLHKKMRLSAGYLRALVDRLTRGQETAPESWAGYDVVVVDGSSFSGPGAEGTDARLHLQLRLSGLEILKARIEDETVGESFKRFDWQPGQLAVGDRGYCNPPGVGHVVGQGADVLLRVNRGSFPMRDPGGDKIALMDWLRGLRGYSAQERLVVVDDHEHNRLIKGRLLACRLPAAEAEKARARVRRELGPSVSPLDLEAAQYIVLFTTVPASRMPMRTCLDLYRLRWQVELTFKRWKSLCHFDRLPNYRDDTILSWLYAKMLLAVVMDRMASNAQPGTRHGLPATQWYASSELLVGNALEGRQYHVARDRFGAVAAWARRYDRATHEPDGSLQLVRQDWQLPRRRGPFTSTPSRQLSTALRRLHCDGRMRC